MLVRLIAYVVVNLLRCQIVLRGMVGRCSKNCTDLFRINSVIVLNLNRGWNSGHRIL